MIDRQGGAEAPRNLPGFSPRERAALEAIVHNLGIEYELLGCTDGPNANSLPDTEQELPSGSVAQQALWVHLQSAYARGELSETMVDDSHKGVAGEVIGALEVESANGGDEGGLKARETVRAAMQQMLRKALIASIEAAIQQRAPQQPQTEEHDPGIASDSKVTASDDLVRAILPYYIELGRGQLDQVLDHCLGLEYHMPGADLSGTIEDAPALGRPANN